jgi:sugar lactone lactonase YvrE
LAVFARGSVGLIQNALQTRFARVAAADGEFTSAVVAPSLPADLAEPVLGIHGLQPHLRHHWVSLAQARRRSAAQPASGGYLPNQIKAAYGATGLTQTGSGQTIAIFGYAYPANTDLTRFWSNAGISDSLTNIQEVNVENGPSSTDVSSQQAEDDTLEASLDVEWASSLAPGAVIRIYGADDGDYASYDEEFQQVIADVTATPKSIQVFSISLGIAENQLPEDYLVIQSQYVATLTASGVTVLAASGDGGSNPDPTTGEYNSQAALSVESPADDPNVTGVGGTSLSLSTANTVLSETAWSDSGGGLSARFARPAWQTGTGVPAGTQRAVPDVSADGDPDTGVVVYVNGKEQVVAGTSLATPVWAAICALIDQARGSPGQPSLGQLNAKLYALNGTAALRDITQGSNGAYSAGPGYDLCTGLGVPNVSALLASSLVTAGNNSAPTIPIQTANPTGVVGQPVTLYTTAAGTPTLQYQWMRAPAGTSTFSVIPQSAAYSGTQTSLLVVTDPTLAMTNDQFECVVTNSFGTVTGPAQTLTVNSTGATTLAGWPGAGGAVDGTGWNARFSDPNGIVIDSSGNLFVADVESDVIRKVTATGAVSVFAGAFYTTGTVDGTGGAARFNHPAFLAIDGSNNLYVADSGNYTIRMITPAGVVSTVAGKAGVQGQTNGPGSSALLYDPEAVTVDAAGNLYVADGLGNTIRLISASGTVSTLAGSSNQGSVDGTGTAAQFNEPTSIAVDGSGTVYVGDSFNNTVRKITPQGVVTTLAGLAGQTGSSDGTGSNARFNLTAGLRVDASGNVWLCDQDNGTLREISPAGVVTTVAGSAGDLDNVDGLASAARFDNPTDLTLAPGGALYVTDGVNYDVRRVTLAAPGIAQSPAGQSITAGQTAVFSVTASGPGILAYQWQIEAVGSSTWANVPTTAAYSGSTTPSLSVGPVDGSFDQDQFRCVVSNLGGSTTSNPAVLAVQGAAPVLISSSPTAVAVGVGTGASLSVSAGGSNLTYQWYFNSVAIGGATSSSYLIPEFQAANAGTYSVTVQNSFGSISTSFTVTVATARLVNLSARAWVGVGAANALVPGFVISGTGAKAMLIRGIGPTLATFNVADPLANPVLTLYDSSDTVLNTNTGWGTTAGGTAALVAAFAQTGAFGLPAGSADSALLQTLNAAAYTASVASVGQTAGVALAELYDADTGNPPTRLVNISARAQVTAANAIVAGFFIGGTGSETVLIRGIGPTLVQYSTSGVLANPVLTVYDSNQNVIAANQGWNAALAATFSQVGAFALPAGSADCALVLSLPAGTGYTAQVSGLNGSSGIALVEIYEVP